MEATVGHRMSIATDTIMAHLSTFIFLSHARLKAEQYSVGKDSPPADIESAGDYVRRVRDQIEMVQYIRGRIGEDRGTILDMGLIPDYYHTRFPAPSAQFQGQKNDQDSPEYSPVTEDDEPVEPTLKRPKVEPALKRPKSSSTVIGSKPFSPMTESDQCSPVTEDESDVQANERHVEVKTEAQADDLLMAKVTSKLTRRQETT
jgi:hypothetical protein